jgi:tripartite-type tricarboxylate transporter receptor subunit TctC
MTGMWVRALLAAKLCVLATGGAWGQDAEKFPARPLRIITGFATGGVSDMIARAVGEQLGKQMGQRFVIDTRPGAGGTLSMGIAARASPDGYSLYLATPTVTLSPLFTERNLGFDPLTAFAPTSLIGTGPTILTVHPSLPVRTVEDLIRFAKSKPDGLRAGHSGSGSLQHLAAELYRVMSGTKLIPVAYRSGQASILGALQGEVEITFLPLSSALPHMEAGRLKGIGLTSERRAKAAPDVPPIAETLPGFNVFSWYGLLVPAATPAPIIAKLNNEIKKALGVSTVREFLERQGVEVQYTTPAEYAKLMREDHQRWAKLVNDAGLVLR